MHHSETLTADVFARLNTRGPRYTSYPTALHFEDDFGEVDVRRAMMEDVEASGRGVSLYVHVPYCKKLCWYCACHKRIERDVRKGDAFVDILLLELRQRANLLIGRQVKQVHFGGGTPTFLTASALKRVMDEIFARYDVVDDAEISIEIDPRTCTPDHAQVLAASRFTRVSLGIQDTDEQVQQAINRLQPLSCIEQCIGMLRDVGIEHVNLDLIYGLPNQTLETIAQTLKDIEQFRPNRLAIYGYAHVPWAHPAQKLLERHNLPDAQMRLEMLALITQTLKAQGYVHIGMDHYARPDDSLAVALAQGTLQRNFQGYSTHKGLDIHGFGPSAISCVPRFYAQNHREVGQWQQAVLEGQWPVARGVLCTDDDILRREVIMELMCRRVVDVPALARRVDLDGEFSQIFEGELLRLAKWQDEGLVIVTPGRIEVTSLGRHFLRNLAMCFDAYLAQDRTNQYSRTV